MLPEQRLFLKSGDDKVRFARLSPLSQAAALFVGALLLGWMILATSIIAIDSIGSDSAREQTLREQRIYAERLNEISAERDARASEAVAAQERFNAALEQVSAMQERLLDSEDRRRELETAVDVIQATLRDTIRERDEAIAEAKEVRSRHYALADNALSDTFRREDAEVTLEFLTTALTETVEQRDDLTRYVAEAETEAEELSRKLRLQREKADHVFSQLEEAVSVSLEPLDSMFNRVGLPPDRIIEIVRRGYSGQGGPIEPIIISTKGAPPDAMEMRANGLLERLAELDHYRIAVSKIPFYMPIRAAHRFTSPFGPRNGRMHKGSDFAAPVGTPIYAAADGVITYTGRMGAYGKLIKVRHDFGMETRYAHLHRIHVERGQKVSRGEHIGDMGNTGRSTGPHLHYEIRINGRAINPMNYIKAARDVH